MKKSSILTLATAAAVVATTAGTFAIWDELNAETNGKFTVAINQAKLSGEANLTFGNPTSEGSGDAAVLVYEAPVSFTVDNYTLLSTLTLTPTVTTSGAAVDASKATVTLEVDKDNVTDSFDGTVDESVTATNSYKVKVKILKAGADLNGQEIAVNVAAVGALN